MAIANLHDPSSWRNESVLLRYLAGQLIRGRLSILLGAGLSQFYGLPNWRDLVDALCAQCGEPSCGPGDDLLLKIAAIREKHFKDDVPRFLVAVHEELYRGTENDFEKIRLNKTLAAIGSLVMASRRGQTSNVVTFNYDDLLETYLEYHGFVVRSVFKPRHWAQNADVTVYHPHGYLPLARNEKSGDIVFGTAEYLQIMSQAEANLWRPLLQTLLRTHTVIYVGLSGTDIHLQSLIRPLSDAHVTNEERIYYHGVRFDVESHRDADTEAVMESWRVYTHLLKDYDALPAFLFRICQEARKLRIEVDELS